MAIEHAEPGGVSCTKANVVRHRVVVVENETGLVDVESLGAVDIADRYTHEFKFEIHDSTVWAGTDGFDSP
jgi:hypothetical protein